MQLLFDDPNGPEETIRFIEEKGGAGLWKWNLRTNIMQWSRGFCDLMGVDFGSVTPSYELLQGIMHPEDIRPPGELQALLSRAGTLKRDYRVILPGGRMRWLSSRGEVLVDRNGRPERAIGMVFDITEQQELRATADAVRDRFNCIVQALGASVWSTSGAGAAVDMTAWCNITGQTPTEAVGMGWLQAVHPEDCESVKQAWDTAVSQQCAYEKEYRLRVANGEYRLVHSRAVPVRDEQGAVREWVGLTMHVEPERDWTAPADGGGEITGAQLRAARALLNWAVRDLGEQSGVSVSTIRRLEEVNGSQKHPEPALEPIRAAFERHGVEFLFPPQGTPTVCLSPRRKH